MLLLCARFTNIVNGGIILKILKISSLALLRPLQKKSELDEYLWYPVEQVKDPLKWWFHNYMQYPNLHIMALDYLSIPHKYFHVSNNFLLMTTIQQLPLLLSECFPKAGNCFMSHTTT
jgi:hAT family C-terminal dimerisation region